MSLRTSSSAREDAGTEVIVASPTYPARERASLTSASKGSCWPALVSIAQNSRCQYWLKDLMASAAPNASSKVRAWAFTLLTAIHGESAGIPGEAAGGTACGTNGSADDSRGLVLAPVAPMPPWAKFWKASYWALS